VNAATLARLAGWLGRPEVRAHAPDAFAPLRAALEDADPPVFAGRGGAAIGYAPGGGRHRLVELDRRGNLVAVCCWHDDGALRWAKCRTARGLWIGIEPRAETHAAWGASDRLWLLGEGAPWAPREALTVFQAVDYGCSDLIPPLLAPARLPPGAGSAVLNLLAGLMKDQGVARARYRGPYPTEQLFTSLLESFRYDPAVDSPLPRFLDGGDLDWLPAPHERHQVAPGVVVQLREEPDTVVLDGLAFRRADWQGVILREPHRLWPDGARRVCSLWALGRAIEDRLVLDASGEVLARPTPRADARPPAPLPPVWRSALAELVARESAPPLGGAIGRVLDGIRLQWGPAPGRLLADEPDGLTLSRALRDLGLGWVAASDGEARADRAVRFALEVARLVAPAVRARAQALVEALPAAGQARLLEASGPAPGPFGTAVGRLVALVAGGGG
jgi:hypothetical protein